MKYPDKGHLQEKGSISVHSSRSQSITARNARREFEAATYIHPKSRAERDKSMLVLSDTVRTLKSGNGAYSFRLGLPTSRQSPIDMPTGQLDLKSSF